MADISKNHLIKYLQKQIELNAGNSDSQTAKTAVLTQVLYDIETGNFKKKEKKTPIEAGFYKQKVLNEEIDLKLFDVLPTWRMKKDGYIPLVWVSGRILSAMVNPADEDMIKDACIHLRVSDGIVVPVWADKKVILDKIDETAERMAQFRLNEIRKIEDKEK